MAVESELTESPWDSPDPSYKLVPPVNPKSGEPVELYVCRSCGGAVVGRKLHSKWHREQSSRRSWP